MSKNGILMTNPGHIDPGYKGRLGFTFINMSRKDFKVNTSTAVATVVFFRLSRDAAMAYGPPRTTQGSDKLNDMLDNLTTDFLSVEKRAKKQARRQIRGYGVLGFLIALISLVASNVTIIQLATPSTDDLTRQQVQQARQIGAMSSEIAQLQAQSSQLRAGSTSPTTLKTP
jgi:hypothetical protein